MARLMPLLVVNSGSSTLKVRLLDERDTVIDDATFARDEHTHLHLEELVSRLSSIDAVGHRVVHGGSIAEEAVVLDDGAISAIESATGLAPLHQPAALEGIRIVSSALPRTPGVGCFDTGFHATLPQSAATYALPAAWRERWPLRRYGFHGLSHAYIARRAAQVLHRSDDPGLRIVSCHLGAGGSLCAIRGGRSVDTTMGFTPLEGLVMATRAGSVDPGLVLWLITEAGLSPREVADGLETSSGLLGLAGTDDMRVLLERRASDRDAALALEVYVHRLAREVGAMAASLGGIDALVFTGGVGEHAAEIRAECVARLTHLGLVIDDDHNRAPDTPDGEVSADGSKARVLVLEAREDLEIARLTHQLLGSTRR